MPILRDNLPPGIDYIGDTHAGFDDMAWPRAGNTAGHVEYLLRHGSVGQMTAASIIAAYRELVFCPRAKREAVIRRLRQIEQLDPRNEDGETL